MKFQIFRELTVLSCLAVAVGCTNSNDPAAGSNSNRGTENNRQVVNKVQLPNVESDAENEEESELEKKLLEAVSDYRQMGRVDDQTRWAPMMCRIPKSAVGRFSASDDDETHGQKLYYMFAKDRGAYVNAAKFDQKIGQVIVKESWSHKKEPEEGNARNRPFASISEDVKLTEEQKKDFTVSDTQSYLPFAEKDGKWYAIDEQTELFIMMKVGEPGEDNDEGWVYGVISADGKKVKASGKIASCMECHVEAPKDRVFGLPTEE